MSKKITMADVAALSGVGKSTVSRYFNGGYVSRDAAERIRQVTAAHDYAPNMFARLHANKSQVIGVVVPTLNSKVTSRVITSIDRCLRERGYTTVIKNSDHDHSLELQNLKRLIGLNVDGIILSAITVTEAHRSLIEAAGIPVVVLAQHYQEGVSVVDDDYQAGLALGRYVGAQGFQRVAYVGVDETDIAVGILRKRGVLEGLAAYGCQPVMLESDYSFEGGCAAAQQLYGRAGANEDTPGNPVRGPEAVICASDRIAYGFYRHLETLGLRIPEDVSLAAFGGYIESGLLKPPLTTVKFDSYQVGRLGAETLLDMLENKEVPSLQSVGFELIYGGSVKLRQN